MHTISILAPSPQFTVVVLTTDPRTLEQYDGLVVTQQKTAATSKGKEKAVAMIKSESDYGQFSSKDKQESEESKSAAQCFQHMQQNKKLATKKANVAKAEAAQQHLAINDFSGHIPNRLGVKVWVPLDVEQLIFLPRTPYELEQLYKYYANEHIPYRNHVVTYMLISELWLFAQWLDDNLHDCTMQVILSDFLYWDLKNPI
ncbi:hypothetical protein C0995_013217 [Termitomyces sp. Mi166|nr:hypothetical protein C0995_013217 [Termitomyces sp. Mi166\